MKNFAVIFDMDGVLVNSNPAHFEAFKQLGERLGVPFTLELLKRSFGLHNSAIFPMWLGSHLAPEEIVRLSEEKEALYRRLAPGRVQPIEGVLALIEELRANQVRLAIGSSGPRKNVELALGILGVADRFEVVCTGDDVTKGKPDPEVFLLAASGLGLAPNRCVVIEDAPAGVLAARAAGMKVVALATSTTADHLVQADQVVGLPKDIDCAGLMALVAATCA